MRRILVGIVLCLMFGRPGLASPILISQTGPGTGSWTLGQQELNAVAWSFSSTFVDVGISADLIGTASGTAYLMNQVGPGTTTIDEIASQSFTETGNVLNWITLFSGLTMGPGTYYLVLATDSPCCSGWGNTESPTVTAAPGTSYVGSYFTTAGSPDFNLTFPPASAFSGSFDVPGDNFAPLQFEVTGTPVPEPATIVYVWTALVLTVVFRRRVTRLANTAERV